MPFIIRLSRYLKKKKTLALKNCKVTDQNATKYVNYVPFNYSSSSCFSKDKRKINKNPCPHEEVKKHPIYSVYKSKTVPVPKNL